MLISFDCPKCLKIAHGEITSESKEVICPNCWWTRRIGQDDLEAGSPAHCLVCGCNDLWRQKDFDQRLGVFIVGLGIVLSTIAVAKMMPGVGMMVLMVFGLADWVLYAVLPNRLVCYRCHAQYRRLPSPAAVDVFDLEVNERYRQEAIRMKQAGNSAGR